MIKKQDIDKLNVGCGEDIRTGWINLDNHDKNGAQVIFDLNKILQGERMPFEDESFSMILCDGVLEDFTDPIKIIDEFIRITKPEGEIILGVPFHTVYLMNNIHHKRGFTIGVFQDLPTLPNYGQNRHIKVEGKYINLSRNKNFGYYYSALCAFIANTVGSRIYESTTLQFIFPTVYLMIKLTKGVKQCR